MMKVIGIDPGLSATGVGIVRGFGLKVDGYSFGSINTLNNISLPKRLQQIFSNLVSVLTDEKPDLMVVEDMFFAAKNPKAGITLGKVSGVILLAACQLNVPVTEIPVREVKQVLTGNGNAGKNQLEQAVRRLLQLQEPIRPYHAADAMGLALLGLFRYQNKKNDRLS